MQQEWFSTWFDSEYYHLLYNNRDEKEAENFIINISNHLNLQAKQTVLDIACGKGRHSITLASLGLDVTGVDLSANSIKHAKQHEHKYLNFYIHDMRRVLTTNYFDAVFNCFTSFGYFKNLHQNELATHAMVANAKPGGYIIVDFINAYKAQQAIGTGVNKVIEREGVNFETEKYTSKTHFIKKIKVLPNNKPALAYEEAVQIIHLEQFVNLFSKNNAELVEHFGDYNLNPFDVEQSPRLIMIFKKVV
jgi:2-polyprenyl-3-methyl-5-hydroxy-6-metoxy-1,4-benzoquinol methylase